MLVVYLGDNILKRVESCKHEEEKEAEVGCQEGLLAVRGRHYNKT